MAIATGIFHAYDIRGIYPEELNEDIAYRLGRAYIRFLKKEDGKEAFQIVVGRDMRLSSPSLFSGFSAGVAAEGSRVVDGGLMTTPMLYFAVAQFGYDGGVMITASHNPNPYNGMKFTRKQAIPIGGESGLEWIRDLLLRDESLGVQGFAEAQPLQKNFEEEYLVFVLRLAGVERNRFSGMKVALDAGNGVGGPFTVKLLEALGAKVLPLCIEPDGRFPNHVPDPLQKENTRDLAELTVREKPDLSVALDGDVDRIMFLY